MFETYMKEHNQNQGTPFWCLKNQDGVYCLVNHNMYLFLRKNETNDKVKVTISPYNNDFTLFQLCMTDGSLRMFNMSKVKLNCEISNVVLADDGGMFTFNPEYLNDVCEIFKIKKKAKKTITEEQRNLLSERMKSIRGIN